jgi:hypothetical protein
MGLVRDRTGLHEGHARPQHVWTRPDGKGVFSPEFDALLVGEGYDVQARKHTDVGAPATAMASSSSILVLARVPRAGAVVRQGGFGRRNAPA